MRVLIASGGTGGHIFPAVSVMEEIRNRKPDTQFLFMGSMNKALQGLGFIKSSRMVHLPAVGMPRLGFQGLGSFAFRLMLSFDQSVRRIGVFRPHVALGFGSFCTLAPLLAAKALGTPVAIHEANAVPGKANLLLSRFSDRVLVHFPRTARYFPRLVREIVKVVGMPVRKEFTETRDKLGALAQLKLSGTRFTLLVAGGSQGARALNREISRLLPTLQEMSDKIQLIHLTGKSDYPWVRACYDRSSLPCYVAAFEPRMKLFYDAADLVVARAGASTIAEIIRTGKPAVLVPFPYATAQHQDENARFLEGNNGAIVLKQQSDSSDGRTPLVPGLSERLVELIGDTRRLQEMSDSNGALSNGSAAQNIADVLFTIARREEVEAGGIADCGLRIAESGIRNPKSEIRSGGDSLDAFYTRHI